MSNNKGKDRAVYSRIKPGSGDIMSEVAKEFSIDGERKNVSSSEGISKNVRRSAESQMSGVPVYTKKEPKINK